MRDPDLFDDLAFDALLTLLCRQLYEKRPSLLEEDEQFMNWLARDLRRHAPSAEDWDAGRVRRVRRRVLDRALAERFRMADGGHEPRMRDVSAASMAHALEESRGERCAPWTALAAAAGEGRELWDEECDRWVELPENIESGRYVALQVAGDSMAPLLHAGDTILVQLGSDVQRDTIVVARRPEDGYVVKRVGKIQRRAIELLSLNPAYDAVLVPRTEHAILGTVVMRWCAHDAERLATIPRH